MGTDKFYYQILLVLPRKEDKLIFWIRNSKIEYSSKNELVNFIKENCKYVKNIHHINKIQAMEIDKKYFDEIDNWYIKNSKPRDYAIIYDE